MVDGRRAGALLGAAALLFAGGFSLGHGLARAKGQAALSELRLAREEERRANAEAYGRTLAEYLKRYQTEAAHANALSTAFAESRKAHAREAEALQRRIAGAIRGSSHTFSPDFVRLYNEAIGLPENALPEALCAFASFGGSGTGGAAGAGLQEPFSGVSEADLLAHITKYGKRCRGLESQVSGWRDLERSWNDRTDE